MISASNVRSALEVSAFQENTALDSLVDNFCLIKIEDALFALEWSSNSLHQLFWETTNKKKYTKKIRKNI